jgi:hypothetical protein
MEEFNIEKKHTGMRNTVMAVILILLVIGCLAMGLYIFLHSRNIPIAVNEEPKDKPTELLAEAKISDLPSFVVKNLPIEADAVVKNYTATIATNHDEIIRTYESKLLMADVFAAYKKYAKDQHLPIPSETNQTDLKSFSAGFTNMTLTVTINKNSLNGNQEVSVIFDYTSIPVTASSTVNQLKK